MIADATNDFLSFRAAAGREDGKSEVASYHTTTKENTLGTQSYLCTYKIFLRGKNLLTYSHILSKYYKILDFVMT